MRVLQVGLHRDPARRDAEALLAAWPTLVDVARAAAAAGAELSVLQAAHEARTLERGAVRFHFAPSLAALLARARALAPDVVHIHGLSFPLATRRLTAALPGAAVLVQDHADRPPRAWRRPLHRWGLAGVDGVAFTSREQARPFQESGILPAEARVFEVLESSSRFTPGDRAEARAATGLSGDPCVLWVGRLNAAKDPLTALDAFALTAARRPDARLWCCFTEAPLLARVRARIAADAVLRGRVHLLGAVPHAQVERLGRAADVLLTSSRREGSGYAVLEMLACGAPVAAADIPALRRIVGEDEGGALFPVGDPTAAAAAVERLCDGDREARRRAVRARFEAELSFEALGRDLCAAYRALATAGA